MSEKLKEYGLPANVGKEFLSDIFGKHSGSTYHEGLVDSTLEKDFGERLEKCRAIWNAREAPTSGPWFSNYFVHYKSVCHSISERICWLRIS